MKINFNDLITPLEQTVLEIIGKGRGKNRPQKEVHYQSHPLLQALKKAATIHIYVDSADFQELDDLIVTEEKDRLIYNEEIDGNTTNQPLVAKVFNRYFDAKTEDKIADWIRHLKESAPSLSLQDIVTILYTIINGRIGIETTERYGCGRGWEISLELHTELAASLENSFKAAWCLSQSNPRAFVKVPFTPHYPHCFLIARELEKAGIAVNFTATFSARQVVAASLLANPHRSNVFIGRLSQGLQSDLLGEHVVLEAQRQLSRLRKKHGLKTLNIVASMRRWQTFALTAGCDVYTSPYRVLKDFLVQKEMPAEEITSKLEQTYMDQLYLKDELISKIGEKQIYRLFVVEPEFIEFLITLRNSAEFENMDGEGLQKSFEKAGFGDFFYAPTAQEWTELKKGKLPDLNSQLTKKISMDTLFSLLAIGDFSNFQNKMDTEAIKIVEKSL
ncbi:transaldolase [Methylacidiphilum caldifontis]|uniref:transaldolase family protein n=1 Tax=Methylacidiphilum caldifontis TaxID=2795386 RepID=UPI001A8D66EA|nr:transaldolase family protein [Methylacidiphilum caldifontis]QSR88830.1 transaldolase [Methylacidiphilum caldifontis]